MNAPGLDEVRSALDAIEARARANGHDHEADESGADDFAGYPDGRITDMLSTPPPSISFFARDRLLADRGHLLAGIGGSSKTRILYHLAVAAVTGRLAWDWSIERTGSAALFLTEDTRAEVHRLIHALGAILPSHECAMLEDRLRVFPLAGHGLRLLVRSGQSLTTGPAYGWLMRQLDALPDVCFFGLDPALALTDGDELDQAHQRRLGELVDHVSIQRRACGVLAVHAAKSLQMADEPGSHTARGAGSLTDAMRGEMVARTMTPDEARRFGITDIPERKRHMQLTVVKGNHLPPEAFAPLWLCRGDHGLLMPATLEDQSSRATEVGPRERAVLRVLLTMEAEKPGASVALELWRKRAMSTGALPARGNDADKKAMQRAVAALISIGVVRKADGARGRYQSEPDADSVCDPD